MTVQKPQMKLALLPLLLQLNLAQWVGIDLPPFSKSLTELQNGDMQIVTDGDLFKVTITFDEAVKEKKPMPPMIVPEAVQEEAQQDA